MRVRVNGRPRQLTELERIEGKYREREDIAKEKYRLNPRRLQSRLLCLRLAREREINALSI
jgi:hypothetical protein